MPITDVLLAGINEVVLLPHAARVVALEAVPGVADADVAGVLADEALELGRSEERV